MTAEELIAELQGGHINADEFLAQATELRRFELVKLTDLLLKWAHRRDKSPVD